MILIVWRQIASLADQVFKSRDLGFCGRVNADHDNTVCSFLRRDQREGFSPKSVCIHLLHLVENVADGGRIVHYQIHALFILIILGLHLDMSGIYFYRGIDHGVIAAELEREHKNQQQTGKCDG